MKVVFRVFETRLYHEFDTGKILRQFVIKEDSFQNVKSLMKGDLVQLVDANLVSSKMRTNFILNEELLL